MRTTCISSAVAVSTLALLAACSAGEPLAPARVPVEAALAASPAQKPQCTPDSKFIGLIEVSKEDRPGTWWYITRNGMDKAGYSDYLGTIESWFGADFSDLDEALDALVGAVVPLDLNANGVICAYETRGTRANYRVPNVSDVIFGVIDDYTP